MDCVGKLLVLPAAACMMALLYASYWNVAIATSSSCVSSPGAMQTQTLSISLARASSLSLYVAPKAFNGSLFSCL